MRKLLAILLFVYAPTNIVYPNDLIEEWTAKDLAEYTLKYINLLYMEENQCAANDQCKAYYKDDMSEFESTLKKISSQRPELIPEALDELIPNEKSSKFTRERSVAVVSLYSRNRENSKKKVKDKNYTIEEKLEAKYGIKKIDGVEPSSSNCNAWSLQNLFRTADNECTHIHRSLRFIQKIKNL